MDHVEFFRKVEENLRNIAAHEIVSIPNLNFMPFNFPTPMVLHQ